MSLLEIMETSVRQGQHNLSMGQRWKKESLNFSAEIRHLILFFSLLQLEKTQLRGEGDWNIITLYNYYYLNLKTIFIICVFLYSVWKWLKASINMVNQIDFLVGLNTENFSLRQTNIKFSNTEQTRISTSLWIGLLKICRQAKSKAIYFPSRN